MQKILATTIILFALLNIAIANETNKTISFQGRLIDTKTQRPITGTKNFKFVIGDWIEEHPNVQVNQGLYSVILGSINPLPIQLFIENQALSLKVNVDGKALEPPVSFHSSIDTFRADYADQVGNMFFVDGKVGIGNNDPRATLDIFGTLNVLNKRGKYNAGVINLGREKADDNYWHLVHRTESSLDSLMIYKRDPGVFKGPYFVIDPSGNVGIGKRNPLAKLHVKGNILSSGRFQIGDYGLPDHFLNHNIEDFIEPNQKSDAFLLIPGYTEPETSDLRLYILDNYNDRFSIWGDSCSGSCRDLNSAKLAHQFLANGTVYHKGNLGLGALNPNAKLTLVGNGGGLRLYSGKKGGHFWIGLYTDGEPGSSRAGWLGYGSDGTRDFVIRNEKPDGNIYMATNGGDVILHPKNQLTVYGNIKCNTVLESSDARYKDNLTPIESPLQKLTQLIGWIFNWKTDEFPDKNFPKNRQYGFIAQQVETFLPHVVYTDNDGFKSVDYTKIIPVMVEGIKELNNKVDMLIKENNALKEIACESNPSHTICQQIGNNSNLLISKQ
ncbi:endosialidase chaperone [Candidatus Magnetomorum sp. HK-1]|nr:endosialidase chaperone [Candidatus Magnetomorum sp. HK-1]